MRGTAQRMIVSFLAMGLVVTLTACTGHWFTWEQRTTLIIGQPAVTGNHGEVLISVTAMPQEGMASMAVKPDGMTYKQAKITNVSVEGLNGFMVLTSGFDDTTGKGRFVIANPNAGSVGGTVAKLTFDVNGSLVAGELAFDKNHIDLGSHLNTLISTWDLVTDKAYYAK